MFDLEKRLNEIDANCAEQKQKAKIIHRITIEIGGLIPSGWNFYPQYGFYFTSYNEEAPAAEFRAVCHVLEKKLGVTLQRTGDNDGALRGHGYYSIEESGLVIAIEVIKHPGTDCKITWEEKMVKVATVDPACLGIHPEPIPEPKPAPEA